MPLKYIFPLLLLTFIFACKKYENGPYLSIIGKKERIRNNWQIDEVIRHVSPNSAVDITEEYADVRIELAKDTAIISFPLNGNIEQLYGNWQLDENKTAITWNVAGDSTFVLLDSMERFDILRLTEKQLWMAYDKFGQYRILKLK